MQPPRWMLPLAAVLLAPCASVRSVAKCDCLDSAYSLLQANEVRRPRDCTCINGMKTHATTPRDTLLGMGQVALRSHLSSCERETTMLGEQLDYTKANGETMAASGDKALQREEKWLEKQTDRAAAKKSKQAADLQRLGEEVSALEKEVHDQKTSYNAQFTEWYNLKEELPAKLARLADCKCKAALLARGRQLATVAPPPEMYDLVQKVEDCETANIKLSDEMEAESTKSRHATIEASESMDTVDRRKTESARVAKLFDKSARVDALKDQKRVLERYVKDEGKRIEDYKEKNSALKAQLVDLDAQVKSCGC